jgi:putative flippase GtrA
MKPVEVTVRAVASFLSSRPHLARYALVGLFCTGLQLLLFRALLWCAVLPSAANSAAFLVSTQVNFFLSHRFTWAHRRGGARLPTRRLIGRCLAFNGAATVGLGVNAVAFLVLHLVLALAPLPSAVAAAVMSTGVTYLVSNKMIFVASNRASNRLENR